MIKQIIFDEWKMILQGGDGGDSAANWGTYHIFLETRRRMGHKVFPDGYYPLKEKEDFLNGLDLLRDRDRRPGLYRRHPDPAFWGSRVNTMSRDQTIPLLGAIALYGVKNAAWDYIGAHLKRVFLFATNTTPNWSDPVKTPNDLTTWQRIKFFFGWDAGHPVYATKIPDVTVGDFWALELRCIYSPWAWPLFFPVLCVLDVMTLIGSFTKVYSYGNDPSNNDDRNHVNVILIGLQICPTPIMKMAALLYSTRPKAKIPDWLLAETEGYDPSGPQSALDGYYGADNSPPFNELGRPIIKYYLEGKLP